MLSGASHVLLADGGVKASLASAIPTRLSRIMRHEFKSKPNSRSCSSAPMPSINLRR